MNKALISVSAAALLAAAPLASRAADGNWFASVNAGRSNFTGISLSKHTANAFDIKGGYRWNLTDNFSLGGEVGFVELGSANGHSTWTQDGTGPATTSPSTVTGPGPAIGAVVPGPGPVIGPQVITVRSTLHVSGPMLGATAKYSFGDGFYATGEVGAYRRYSNLSATTTYAIGALADNVEYSSLKTHDIEPFGGVGVGYMITPNVDVSVNFDRFGGSHDGGSVNYTSLGVGVDF